MSKVFEFFKELPEYPEVCKDLRNSVKLKGKLHTRSAYTLESMLWWDTTGLGDKRYMELDYLLSSNFPSYSFSTPEVLEMIGNVPKYIKVPKNVKGL